MWHILPHERVVTSAGKKWCWPVGGFFLLSGEGCCSLLFIFPFDSFIVTVERESSMGALSLLFWLSCTLPIQSHGSLDPIWKLQKTRQSCLSGLDHVLSLDFTKCDSLHRQIPFLLIFNLGTVHLCLTVRQLRPATATSGIGWGLSRVFSLVD